MKKISMKTLLALSLMLVLFSGMGLAAWKLSLNGQGITGLATSQQGGVMMVQKDFDQFSLMETTNQSVDFNTHAEIKNNNGVMNFTLELTEIRDDVDDDCTDYLDDVSIVYEWNGVLVTNNETVTLDSGINYLNMTAHAVLASCPQNISINWGLVE